MRSPVLSEKTQDQLDRALGKLLTAYGSGHAPAHDFIRNVMHMVTAVDDGNVTEIATFINNPLLSYKE